MVTNNQPGTGFELTAAFYNAVLMRGPTPHATPVATVVLPSVPGSPGSQR